MLTSLKPRTTV